MSYNQPRSDRSEAYQRKLGRSASSNQHQQRGSTASYGRGAGPGPAPSPSSSTQQSNRSYNNKKASGNAQGGGQYRVTTPAPNHHLESNTNSPVVPRTAQNGSHSQPQLHGLSDVPVASSVTKPTDSSNTQRSTKPVPKAPASQPAPVNGTSPTTQPKSSVDAAKEFAFQFGSISPGFMNVMQVPARTSSAPPNLDEQKNSQARHESSKPVPNLPTPGPPKQQLPRKEVMGPGQSNVGEGHQPVSKSKKDMHVPPTLPVISQTQQKPSVIHNPMQSPFHQPPVQFGVPHLQIQSQGVGGNAAILQMQQQPVLFQHQHHMAPHQGMMHHQGQGLNFTNPMAFQLPPNMGGIGINPQYAQQQQGGKFGGPRKSPIKITDPRTHEELRLDESEARTHPNLPPQNPPMSYYPNSYTPNPMYFPSETARPLTSVQVAPPRFTYPVISQGPQNVPSINQSRTGLVTVKPPPGSRPYQDSVPAQPQKDAKTVPQPMVSKSLPTSTKQVAPSEEPPLGMTGPSEEPQPSKEANIKESLSRSNSLKEQQNKSEKKGQSLPQNLVEPQPTPVSSLASQNSEIVTFGNAGSSEILGAKTITAQSVVLDGSSELSEPDTSKLNVDNVTKPDDPATTEGNYDSEVCRELKVSETNEQSKTDSISEEASVRKEVSTIDNEASTLENVQVPLEEPVSCHTSVEKICNNSDVPEMTSESDAESVENSVNILGSKDKSTVEPNKKNSKKRMKELLQKKDAEGTSSDLYNAYKGSEEKNINVSSSEVITSEAPVISEQTLAEESAQIEKSVQNKTELDDWEDAAELSTPKLQTPMIENQNENGESIGKKKYSRDFLIKFADQCIELPVGFEVIADISDSLMGGGPGHVSHRDSLRRQAVNFSVVRNVRGPIIPVQYGGGILSGPMQSMGGPHQVGMQRNNYEPDKWQRSTSFRSGLIPSPQTPLQVMHKAENKYEVGKVTDEEQAKQRQLKAILNKLTPQNFEKLFEQVKAVNIDNAVTLTGVISQIFDKALTEPTFCQMYANFCSHLAGELPDFTENGEKITFKRLLLNKCQEEFERGEREEEEANQADEGTINLSEQEREEKRVKARRLMLGNIRLIGELYKKRMLTERIMHECIKKLLGEYESPDEENVEALCKLMSTIGDMIDHPKAKEHMDAYFERMKVMSNNMNLSSRVRFMLRDSIELRLNKWQQRRKIEGPKKIEEVHRDAAQERQSQASRLSRNNPTLNPSPRRDFNPRGPMLPSPNSQMGGFRGPPPQFRSGGYQQDIRFEERLPYDPRTLSLRPNAGEESITLGPQGGLARGMSRGLPTISNGFNSMQERAAYTPAAFDQYNGQDRSMLYANRPVAVSPLPVQGQGSALNQNITAEKEVYSEERLRDMSTAAIKEFYSARDEKEVALCIKDLNSPSFHPSMISLWVTDSFERKDNERVLLANLLISLARSQDEVLRQPQLIKGFESVLATLEDAVNDAPKAPEFLGSLFAKVVMENIVSLTDIGQLLREGGEEPGSLLEFGLAGDVLGNTLEKIKLEKGEDFLNEIRSSSSLRLDDFRPPVATNRSKILEKFIQ
ncbi:hypothetical protein ACFE04_019383 [Oxalis oulophora]